MLIKFDIPDGQKPHLNMFVLKELFQKYGYRGGHRIKPHWVEQLMHEIDPYKYFLEWDVPQISLQFAVDLKKLLNACKTLPELGFTLPSGAKFIIKRDEHAVQIYERMKEEL